MDCGKMMSFKACCNSQKISMKKSKTSNLKKFGFKITLMMIFMSKNGELTNLMDEEHSFSMRISKTINFKKFVHRNTLMVFFMSKNGKITNLMDEEYSISMRKSKTSNLK